MTFRLTTLLYLFALLGSSMALFAVKEPKVAPLGLLLGSWIFWGWKCLKRDPDHYKTLVGATQFIGVFVLLPILLGILLQPSIARAYPRGPYLLGRLALAIEHYHRDHGHYPPPYVADEAGNPLLSWRVLILPYIGQGDLADQFRHDEPWDSPHNVKLLADVYDFRSDQSRVADETNFVAVVAEGTLWNPNRKVSADDVTDNLKETLLLMEVPSQGINWSQPRDLSLDDALALLEDDQFAEQSDNGYFISRRHRVRKAPALVAMADGTIHELPPALDRTDALALLNVAGGEPTQPLDAPERVDQQYIVHWHRILNAGLFVTIVLLPLSRRLAIFAPKPV